MTMKLTPMLEQYLGAKEEHPEALLLFRMGDFYELFFEDAEKASKVLNLTLTTRSKKDDVPIPMCGVPHHAVQPYVTKLLASGFKVAICDQMEDPSTAKGLVARSVVRVVTPGTVTEEEHLDPKRPNYLAAVADIDGVFAVVSADLSTGEVRHDSPADESRLLEVLGRRAPREILIAPALEPRRQLLARTLPDAMLSNVSPQHFDAQAGADWLRSIAPATEMPRPALAALGAVLRYLRETHRASLVHLRRPEGEDEGGVLVIDEATRRNLELLQTTRGERRGSLLAVIDQSETPMGSRLLRQWMLAPLTDVQAIGARLDAVEELVRQPTLREEVAKLLGMMGDLERLNARVAAGRVTPRDLLGLMATLGGVDRLRAALGASVAAPLCECARELLDLPHLRRRIEQTLSDEPPLNPRAGGVVRDGFDPRVDELRQLSHQGKRFFSEFEQRERARTGVASLKIRYNRVFGYYIEVTQANLHLVPAEYRRKQTLANAERFVTPELQAAEEKVLGAEERLLAVESEIFTELRDAVAAEGSSLAVTASALARVDVFSSLAGVALRHQYTRPQVTRARRLVIEGGRHPVVEVMAGRQGFVPNDSHLDPEDQQILILTGPNMAGKSTYLRQVALITLLTQMGSFVPATRAEVGVVDRLFTRIGASDNLAGGESTFMVEMKETAHILQQLTARSLVVLDEIGRGTSTFDGISIAWAVAEYLHDQATERPLVLFATHYHELTDLARSKDRVHNFSVAVREWKGEVLFLRRIIPGPASQSYGIQVARLAGVPERIVSRAKEILANLERGELDEAGRARLAAGAEDELLAIDVDQLAPVEALNQLHRLVQLARKTGGS